ncbi:MAG: hypothetical protein V1719_01190 [Patescibacteria group bacterium]
MTLDIPDDILRILGPNMDLLMGSVLSVSPDEITKAKKQVKDLEKALKAKKEKEESHLVKADEIGILFDKLEEVIYGHPGNKDYFLLAFLLKEEKNYHQDQANRQHVNDQEKRVEEAKQYLRNLLMKRELLNVFAAQ